MNEIIFDVSGKVPETNTEQRIKKFWCYKNMREDGKYMPDFLMDFHNQKDFFKVIFHFYELELAKQGKKAPQDYNWQQLHIYSVDILFYCMIRFGYRLSRSRKRLPFLDYDTVEDKLRSYNRILFYSLIKGAENKEEVCVEAPNFDVDEKVQAWIDSEQHLPEFFQGKEKQVRFYNFMDDFMDLSDRYELKNCDKLKFMEYGVNALLQNAAKFGFIYTKVKMSGDFEDLESAMVQYGH